MMEQLAAGGTWQKDQISSIPSPAQGQFGTVNTADFFSRKFNRNLPLRILGGYLADSRLIHHWQTTRCIK